MASNEPSKEASPEDAPAAPEKGETPSGRPEREATLKDYVRVFTYAKTLDYVLFVGGILSSIGAGVTLPLMNVVFGQLVGSFNNFVSDPTGSPGQFQGLINQQALYIFALFVARFGLNYINRLAFRMIGIRMSAGIRLDFLRALFAQSIHVLDSLPSGAAASTITATANVLQLGISEKLGIFVEYMSTVIAAVIVAFIYSWSLTLVTASTIVFIFVVLSILLPAVVGYDAKINRAHGKAGSIATEAFSAIRMVSSCGAEARIAAKHAEWVRVAKRSGQVLAPIMAAQFGLVFFSMYAAFSLAFWYGAKSLVEGRVRGVQDVVIVLMSVMMIVVSFQQVATPLLAMSKAMVAAAEFFVVIDAPRPPNGTLRAPDVAADQDIVFEGVHFAYPSRPSKKVLDGLDLRLEANKNTAIVGPSGSGKSTVVGLIQGWYGLRDQHAIARAASPEEKQKKEERRKKREKAKKAGRADQESDTEEEQEEQEATDSDPPVELKGSISTCGRQLGDIDLKWWRSQIGLVQQEPFLFNDTIFSNVAMGLVGTEWEHEPEERKRALVKEACVESFADEFVDRLPHGYDTQVGDSGTKLSGGQRQRLAIARSIISRPKILILDEATSAIDVRGERIVQASLDRASRGRTTITIAHRLSTIKNADRICVLQRGRVVEQGTHDALLADADGAYYGLVHAQKLSMGDAADDDTFAADEEDMGAVLGREKSAAAGSEAGSAHVAAGWKAKNLVTGFGRLLGEQKSRFPIYAIAVAGAMLASSGIPVQAYIFGKLVVSFQKSGQALIDDASFWALMWFVLALAVGLGFFITAFAATSVEHHVSSIYRQQYFESLLYQKTAYFDQDDNSVGQLSARLSADPQALRELLGVNIMMAITGVFSLIGALAISFSFGWKLALVALSVTIPLGVASGFFRVRYELQFNSMNEAVFQESSKFGAEAIGAFRTVCSLVLEDSICDRYDRLLAGHVTEAFVKARLTTVVFALSDSVSLGCQALVFWYGGRLLLTGEYSAAAFFVTLMAVIQGAESAGQWLSLGPNAAQASAAANRILSIRDSRNLDTVSAGEQIPDTESIGIEFRGVHFRYPTRDVSIFRGLDLSVAPGQFAALVGASGSGKSSIVSLLERFYDPVRGAILFNGRDISEINLYEYRKMLSLVAQEPSLFQGTIRENILLGVDPAQISEERLHECARDANIHDFVVSLPDGYDTQIGSRGVSLSGGQKQRVSIARALVRNPRVLLLDEATSSLDSESEKLVQAAFERVAKGRTTIAVAHRLATIQNADVIYVLGEGKVLEKGSHAELLKARGVYWHMCRNQALDR